MVSVASKISARRGPVVFTCASVCQPDAPFDENSQNKKKILKNKDVLLFVLFCLHLPSFQTHVFFLEILMNLCDKVGFYKMISSPPDITYTRHPLLLRLPGCQRRQVCHAAADKGGRWSGKRTGWCHYQSYCRQINGMTKILIFPLFAADKRKALSERGRIVRPAAGSSLLVLTKGTIVEEGCDTAFALIQDCILRLVLVNTAKCNSCSSLFVMINLQN